VALHRDVGETAAGLGPDAPAWQRFFGPLVDRAEQLYPDLLGTLRRLPKHPLTLARFGLPALRSARAFAEGHFREPAARALFAGATAHSMRSLDAPFTTAYGAALTLMGHDLGWPVVEGGSQRIVDALVARLRQLGGEIVCDQPVRALAELPPARVRLLDIGPAQLLRLSDDLPPWYRRALHRYRYGPGVFKVDYALSEPVPWAAEVCRRAGTVHVGGPLEQINVAETEAERGRMPERPYVLAVQATVADPTRAPAGGHTLWAYTHVPAGSPLDHTAAIEAQLERFAPGFADVVLARHTRTAAAYEDYDANYVGGDINAGRPSLWATFAGPVPRWSRYRVPLPGTFLCSSATAPGGGVHGMSGYHAAREALRHDLR
jgi:phytoene dehydrogenase-like protein